MTHTTTMIHSRRSSSLLLALLLLLTFDCSAFLLNEVSTSRQRRGNISPRWVTRGDEPSSSSSQPPQLPPPGDSRKKEKRKMDLMWCEKDYCKDVVRERVLVHNQIILNGPATGQVAYRWQDEEEANGEASTTSDSYVLFLVRPGNKELEALAAQAVQQLVSELDGVQILLEPNTAARLYHSHGVQSDRIHLYESKPTPGFGSNLRPNDVVQGDEDDSVYVLPSELVIRDEDTEDEWIPDLICTLGGDGLLMHAGMMFQGPVPPILCVSGGSLGFLTTFERTELVDSVRIALGLIKDSNSNNNKLAPTATKNEIDVFPPNMSTYPYEPLTPPASIAPHHQTSKNPRYSFGLNGYVCLSIRMRLECRIITREGAVRARYNVLNEVVIDRGSSPYLAALECFCDDVHLTTVQADGVIFATPTGSTAYSMAAGGSVVHPAVPCILVTPICPHVLSFRSMIFPDHVVLSVYVPDDARSEASVAFDGKHRQELHRGDSVQIQASPYPVPTVNRVDHSSDWLGSLKRNFNFNARSRQRPL